MKIKITKSFPFEGARKLPNYKGKCSRLNGHSYRMEVSVTGEILMEGSSECMVIDFDYLNQLVDREIVIQLYHQYLNDILDFPNSVKGLALNAYMNIKTHNSEISGLRLWETPTAYTSIYDSNINL